MLQLKLVGVIGVAMLVSTLQDSCPTGNTDPPPLGFKNARAACGGGVEDSRWIYELDTIGWAMDSPYVVVFDNYDVDVYNHDPNSALLWTEMISFNLEEQVGDETTGEYWQSWRRDDLAFILTSDLYEQNLNTLFSCPDYDELTFVFYATDYFDGSELCVGMGMWPDVYAPTCYN